MNCKLTCYQLAYTSRWCIRKGLLKERKIFQLRGGGGGGIVLITQTLTPHKIGWIKCSFLQFPQIKDMAYTIRVP